MKSLSESTSAEEMLYLAKFIDSVEKGATEKERKRVGVELNKQFDKLECCDENEDGSGIWTPNACSLMKTVREIINNVCKTKGKLKSARLARAENLSPEDRNKFNLPDKGLVVIEIREEKNE